MKSICKRNRLCRFKRIWIFLLWIARGRVSTCESGHGLTYARCVWWVLYPSRKEYWLVSIDMASPTHAVFDGYCSTAQCYSTHQEKSIDWWVLTWPHLRTGGSYIKDGYRGTILRWPCLRGQLWVVQSSCILIHMRAHTYTYIHAHVHMHIHIDICPHIHTLWPLQVFVCVCMYLYVAVRET